MIKRILFAAVAASLIAGPLTGCASKQEAASPLHVSFEPNIATDLKNMSERAGIVVLGKFGKDYKVYNGSRNPQNPKQPSKILYSEARSYPFQVIKSLKGNTASTIRVNMLYNLQIDGLRDEEGKPVKLTIPSSTFFEPDPAKTYLLFLRKDQAVGGYTIDFQPYAIAFDATGKAELVTPRKETVAMAKDGNNEKREVVVHSFVDQYTDTVSGKALTDVIREVSGYVK